MTTASETVGGTIENTSSYQFTEGQDWFSHNIPSWTPLLSLVNSKSPRVLEIGSWEGRSGVWMLQNLCSQTGSLVCIDHFDLKGTSAGRDRFDRIHHNLSAAGGHYRVLPAFSFPALMTLLEEEISAKDPGYDWIYVDGSHDADDTLLDGELAWRLARKGAIFIFDDYNWSVQPPESMQHPRRGIDAFLALHEGQYTRLSKPSNYQVVLQKTSEMRIGFLIKADGHDEVQLHNNLGYSINVALTIDTAYAPAAAVTMRSLAEHTPGRIAFYIVHSNLSGEDRDRLQLSLPARADLTINFVDLPSTGIAHDGGMTWAKIQMLGLLPIERVLYLDADLLIRGDITSLWHTNIDGYAVAAAQDVGHPMGHGPVAGTKYFNAGVILFNLARIRPTLDTLQRSAQDMLSSHFKDQDVLNKDFRSDWLELPLTWNAQGLGTYADHHTTERSAMQLDTMKDDPRIVHFTGPIHPDLASVLNPYVQPVTAKPWGYVGAPGHPYAEEWWSTLERTAWKGWKETSEFKAECSKAAEEMEKEALRMFRNRVHDSN